MLETFHRRPLPPALIALSSDEGRRLFAEALAAGTMEGYFAIAEHFQTQAEPAYCGLTSLTIVLNSLGIDPGRRWKGPWRWFDETMLDCCVALDEVRARGITLDELACLARCNGARAEVERGEDHPLAGFRAHVARMAGTADGPRLLASYARGVLDQTGEGHFSPVAGYHAGRDLALVLDVARFKYPPHWVAITTLHAATRTIDPATGRSRGWIVLSRATRSAAFALQVRSDRLSWAAVGALVAVGRAAVARAVADATAEDRALELSAVAQAWLVGVRPLVAAIGFRELLDPALVVHRDALKAELLASRAGALAAALAAGLELDAGFAALLLLAAPAPVLDAAGAMAGTWRALREALSPALIEQLELLDAQLAEVITSGSCCVR
jgi:glutathione gamma-glutamylcysteinyltransferase